MNTIRREGPFDKIIAQETAAKQETIDRLKRQLKDSERSVIYLEKKLTDMEMDEGRCNLAARESFPDDDDNDKGEKEEENTTFSAEIKEALRARIVHLQNTTYKTMKDKIKRDLTESISQGTSNSSKMPFPKGSKVDSAILSDLFKNDADFGEKNHMAVLFWSLSSETTSVEVQLKLDEVLKDM